MSFTFEPRTLLEMGKELISSDEVAIYELIKNAVDAQSPKIEILLNIHLLYRDYMTARSLVLDKEQKIPEIRDFIAGKLIKIENHNFIDGKLITTENPNFQEFLDALSSTNKRNQFLDILDRGYHDINYMIFRDSGEGMSLDDLKNIFLRIGTRSRHIKNQEGATHLGDKGIGRLSSMRLGDRLRVKTTKSGEKHWNILDIDWTMFSHDSTKRIEDIHIEPFLGEEKEDVAQSGTDIIISGVKDNWNPTKFSLILGGRISRMVDPFVVRKSRRLLRGKYNDQSIYPTHIPPRLLEDSHAYCHIEFNIIDGEPRLSGFIDYKMRRSRMEIDRRGAEIYSLVQNIMKKRQVRDDTAIQTTPIDSSTFEKLGHFTSDIYWYDNEVVETTSDMSIRAERRKAQISHWNGGVMLYRHGFRILPYGDPGNDWLELDKMSHNIDVAPRMSREQIIGRVLLQSPHSSLTEQTNREGLVESEESNVLKRILKWVIGNEMRGFMYDVDRKEEVKKHQALKEMQNTIPDHGKNAREIINSMEKHLPDHEKKELLKSIDGLQAQSVELVKKLNSFKKKSQTDRQKFSYLAGIGLMSEFMFHELERVISQQINKIKADKTKSKEHDFLKKLETMYKRMDAISDMSVRRHEGTKRNIYLKFQIEDIFRSHEKELKEHGIKVNVIEKGSEFSIKGIRGMFIQILENLTINSIYWLKQQKHVDKWHEGYINVILDSENKRLIFEDNGPGVPFTHRERIFQPFMTTKPGGEGRGLGLHICRDLAQFHDWNLRMDDKEGDIHEGRVNRFILDMEKHEPSHDYVMADKKEEKSVESNDEVTL